MASGGLVLALVGVGPAVSRALAAPPLERTMSVMRVEAAPTSPPETTPTDASTPSPTTSPSDLPVPASTTTTADAVDAANLAIQVAMLVLGAMTLVLAGAAFFGIREARSIRQARQALETAHDENEALARQLQGDIDSLHQQFETLVLVAHLFQEGQSAYARQDYEQGCISLPRGPRATAG